MNRDQAVRSEQLIAAAIDAAEVASPRGRNTAAEIASLQARPEPGK